MINSINAKDVSKVRVQGHLFIQPQIPETLVRKQMEQTIIFGSVWPEYLTTPLKVVHFGLSYWYDQNDPFHLT